MISSINKYCVRLLALPKLSFSKRNNNSSLSQKLDEEIKFEMENKPDCKEQLSFFKEQGWAIAYSGIQVHLSKKNGPYNMHVIFYARSPVLKDDAEQSEEGKNTQVEEENYEEDFSEVTAFINKTGQKKWMCSEYLISNNESQLSNLFFVDDFDTKKLDSYRGSDVYQGPDLNSLEESVLTGVNEFIEEAGINNNLLQKVADYSIAHEHQFYLDWLKDVKSLL